MMKKFTLRSLLTIIFLFSLSALKAVESTVVHVVTAGTLPTLIIKIENTNKGDLINIYTEDGQLLKSFRSVGNEEEITVNNKGVYFINTNHKTKKIIL